MANDGMNVRRQKMKNIGTLIIGGGVSGLTYAAYAKGDYLIVEKESTPGGLCRTFYEDGFVWDYAGHFFHFARPELKAEFEREISPEDFVKCVKRTNINYNGVSVDYPFQMNIHQLPKEEFIDCLYDLFHRNEQLNYDNFEEMLYGKFGRSITEKFLKPYNEKLYACDLMELDTDAMGRFFPYANPMQIIDNMKAGDVQTYNSAFDYPRRGAQFFVDLLLKKVDAGKIWLDAKVEFIDIDRKTAVINGIEYQYDRLINTIPLNCFVQLLPWQFSRGLDGKLSCNKVLVFNLGFDQPAVDNATHWTYVPMKNVNFYRMGYYSNILGTDRLSMYIEIGYCEGENIDERQQLRLTLENLRRLGVITDHKLVAYNTLVINPGYVHITTESIKAVDTFCEDMAKVEVYTIGRYGKWTYCSIEDCMVDAMILARKHGQ